MRNALRISLNFSAVFVLGSAVGLAACGDDFVEPTGTGGAGATGGSGGAGGTVGTATGTFSAMVYEVGPYDQGVASPTPMEGATVAADLPGGERVEATTGADGQATFEGVDWSLGTATVTAFSPGYRPITWMGLTEEDQRQTYYMFNVDAPPWAPVSGTASNPDPQSTTLTLSPTVPGTGHQSSSFDFTIGVAPDTPFSLVALQWAFGPTPSSNREVSQDFFGWTHVEHAAITGPTTVDVDLADQLTPVAVAGTMVLPTDPASALRTDGWAYYQVQTWDTGAYLGFVTRTHLAASEDEFTYVGEHVVVPDAGDVVTVYYVGFGDGGITVIREAGYPEDGATIQGFLEPPNITRPANPGVGVPLTDPIELATPDSDVEVVTLGILKQGAPRWILSAKAGATTFEVPALPSTANPAEVLGGGVLEGVIYLQADCDELECARYVGSEPFRLSQ